MARRVVCGEADGLCFILPLLDAGLPLKLHLIVPLELALSSVLNGHDERPGGPFHASVQKINHRRFCVAWKQSGSELQRCPRDCVKSELQPNVHSERRHLCERASLFLQVPGCGGTSLSVDGT